MILIVLILLVGILCSCENEPEVLIEASIVTEGGRFLQGYPVRLSAKTPPKTKIDHITFFWDFGDGLVEEGLEVEHIYPDTGIYEIRLTLEGRTNSKSDVRTIKVKPSLELLTSVSISVDEPSGLTLGAGNTSLWTVSDRTGDVYQLDFSGQIMETINFNGGDLESICFDSRDSTFWIGRESSNSILHIDSVGNILLERLILGVSEGSGLEGIDIDTENIRLYAIKEKDNSVLITLNDSLETLHYERIGFAPDFSGVCYSESMEKLWLLSHESASVYLADTTGSMISAYGINMNQPEGIVYDDESGLFYIVDDATERLNTYGFWGQTPSF